MKLYYTIIFCLLMNISNAQKTSTKPNTGTSISTTTKSFSFLGSFTMKFDLKDTKGKTSNGVIRTAFDNNRIATVPIFSEEKEKTIRSIFELTPKTMTMLITDTKGTKNGMIMRLPKVIIKNKSIDKNNNGQITKTGIQKRIDNYNCEKYLITNADGSGEVWVTKDVTINTSEAIAYLVAGMKGKPAPINLNGADVGGCVIESTYTTLDGSVIKMKISEIKAGAPDPLFFNMNGFKLADVTNIEFFK